MTPELSTTRYPGLATMLVLLPTAALLIGVALATAWELVSDPLRLAFSAIG